MKKLNVFPPLQRSTFGSIGFICNTLLLLMFMGNSNLMAQDSYSYFPDVTLYPMLAPTPGTPKPTTDESHHLIREYSNANLPDADVFSVCVAIHNPDDPLVPNSTFIRLRAIDSRTGVEYMARDFDLSPYDVGRVVLTAVCTLGKRYIFTGYTDVIGGNTNTNAFILETDAGFTWLKVKQFALLNDLRGLPTPDPVYTVPLDITYYKEQYYVAGYISNVNKYETVDFPWFTTYTNTISNAQINPMPDKVTPFQYYYTEDPITNQPTLFQFGFVSRFKDDSSISLVNSAIIGADPLNPTDRRHKFTAINRIKPDETKTVDLLITGTAYQATNGAGQDVHGAMLTGFLRENISGGDIRTATAATLSSYYKDATPDASYLYSFATANDIYGRINANNETEYWVLASTAETFTDNYEPEETTCSLILGKIDFTNNGNTMEIDPANCLRYLPYPSITLNQVTPPSAYTSDTYPRWFDFGTVNPAMNRGNYMIAKGTQINHLADPDYNNIISISGIIHNPDHDNTDFQRPWPYSPPGKTFTSLPFFIGTIDLDDIHAGTLSNPQLRIHHRLSAYRYAADAPYASPYAGLFNPVLNNHNFIKLPHDNPPVAHPLFMDRYLFTTNQVDFLPPTLPPPPPSYDIRTSVTGVLNLSNAFLNGIAAMDCYYQAFPKMEVTPGISILDTYTIWENEQMDYGHIMITTAQVYESRMIDCDNDKDYIKPASTADVREPSTLYLSPNPAQQYIGFNNTASVHYTLRSIEGKILAQGQLKATETISVAALAPGMYIVELRLADNSKMQFKFVRE